MPYITVDVDVDLDEFEDQDLIDELEGRGWYVGQDRNWIPKFEDLTNDEEEIILRFLMNAEVGTPEYFLYQKLLGE